MKKLSEIIRQYNEAKKKPVMEMPYVSTEAPALVLFDNVLDADKVIHSADVHIMSKGIYGDDPISVLEPENKEEFQSWLRNELFASDNESMTYPVKTGFDQFEAEGHSEEYSGPLNVIIFRPRGTDSYYLVLTCRWGDNLFRNDYAVVGVICPTMSRDK